MINIKMPKTNNLKHDFIKHLIHSVFKFAGQTLKGFHAAYKYWRAHSYFPALIINNITTRLITTRIAHEWMSSWTNWVLNVILTITTSRYTLDRLKDTFWKVTREWKIRMRVVYGSQFLWWSNPFMRNPCWGAFPKKGSISINRAEAK